jgi:hypothetical protein
MSNVRRQLLKLFDTLDDQAQRSLLDYAGYLRQRDDTEPSAETEKAQPLNNPRPQKENVVNAIKRLRASYYMLDTDKLLNETSTLMAQFMMQGRPADEVIDDLESLFTEHYQKYLDS